VGVGGRRSLLAKIHALVERCSLVYLSVSASQLSYSSEDQPRSNTGMRSTSRPELLIKAFVNTEISHYMPPREPREGVMDNETELQNAGRARAYRLKVAAEKSGASPDFRGCP
jgi:hypothetical protein